MSNFDTNPCDDDLSKTKTIDKIQLRRGNLIDLPQPLKAGEIGWAMDSQKLFIGTSCDHTPSGVQIIPGNFSYAQTLIDNSTILIELLSSYSDAEYTTFKTNIQSSYPTITDDFIRYDGNLQILLGLPSGFSDTAGLITLIESQLNVVTPVTVGSGYTVSMVDGTISGINDVESGMLSHILNNVADAYVARNLLNVRIITQSDKGEPDGYVPLDGSSKISSQYLPAISISEVFVVADIAARDALVIGDDDGEVQTGDVAVVTDASADLDVDSGGATYMYNGSDWILLETPESGGLTFWEENFYTASPNDTKNSLQWTTTSGTTNVNVVLTPKGTGAIQAQVADATATGGNTRGNNAIDWQMVRSLGNQVASGNYSVLVGGQFNEVSGPESVVVGGNSNIANGQYSFVGGGSNNDALAENSFVGGGDNNAIESVSVESIIAGGSNNYIPTGIGVGIAGGNSNTAEGNYSVIIGGQSNSTNAAYAIVLGGEFNEADGQYSISGGRRAKALHAGSMVLTDDQDADHSSTQTRELRLRFENGAYLNGVQLATVNDVSSISSIDDLSDVVVTSPTNDQLLSWNGSEWVNVDNSSVVDESASYTWTANHTWSKVDPVLTLDDTDLDGRSYSIKTQNGQFLIDDDDSASNRFLITSAGKVSIGDSSPPSEAKLFIRSSSSTSGDSANVDIRARDGAQESTIEVQRHDFGTSFKSAWLQYTGETDLTLTYLDTAIDAHDSARLVFQGSSSAAIYTTNGTQFIAFGIDGIEKMRLSNTGLNIIDDGELTVNSNVVQTSESDTTANRPGSPVTGQTYFDTDLGQPIWYDGTNWVDATGTTV